MKAAFIQQPGPPESIQYGELPEPTLADNQVLVRVASVAVNPIDTYLRAGMIAMELPKPYILGCDLAGTVERVGPAVTRFKPGDAVWGSNQGLMGRQGTFAEFCAVDEPWLYPRPDSVSTEDAAALALVGITAHLGLVQRAKLRAGETLFVTGGSGGVGSTVVQMAKALGARVITTAGSPDKAEQCRRLGADEVILYRDQDVGQRLSELAPDGVNVWWEVTRTPAFEMAVSHMAPRARFVLMAGREARPVFPVGPFYTRDMTLHGFAMFNAPPEEQRQAAMAMNEWMSEGRLKAQIGRVLPLEEAAAAHRLQEDNTLGGSGTLAGKIVLNV